VIQGVLLIVNGNKEHATQNDNDNCNCNPSESTEDDYNYDD
jgi:hypothetical protein